MSYPSPRWWKEGTAYQIWPMSYKDSDGDGIGDIPGIISTLDYLKNDLCIDIIWLSPTYSSPQKDYGYDISNYEDVYPPFGTLKDMETLIDEVHNRGMKLILDLVVNHTSDQHAWFKESKSSKHNEKADWYIWRDAKYDSDGTRRPPNNWRAYFFGGSAWEWVEERQQYYLHLFVPEQPDLNWENEVTRRAIYKSAVEFWLDRGLDGFRVDTVNIYSKDQNYPDAPITVAGEEFQPAWNHFVNGPRMHEWLKEMRRECLDKYGDVMMVGECDRSSEEEVYAYVSDQARELSCVFDFDVVSLGGKRRGLKKHQVYKHTLIDFKEAWWKVQRLTAGASDAWGTVFLENHDQGRSLSRFATDGDQYREKAAKLLAIMLGSLTGTLFLYQGQEIGMVNIPRSWGVEEIKDVDSLNYYEEMKKKYNGDELWLKRAMTGIQRLGRDNARTPVQWTAGNEAGFTTGKAWTRVHDNYEEVNIEKQLNDEKSPLKFWKKMVKLRQEYMDVLVYGEFSIHDYNDPDVFTFIKKSDEKKIIVYCNFSEEEQPMDIPPHLKSSRQRLLISNVEEAELGKYLTPWEGRAYLVD